MALINCPNCNEKISDKAAGCPHCGFNMGEMIICPECGKWIKNNQENCPECGCPISSMEKSDDKSVSKKEQTKAVIKDIGDIIKPTSEQKKFLVRRKKAIIIIGICIIIALALIISYAIVKSEKEELYMLVWGSWEAYAYEDEDQKTYYDDLLSYELEDLEIELDLMHDGTYYLETDEVVEGTWDITADSHVKLYVKNKERTDLEIYYDRKEDELSITTVNRPDKATFHFKRL